MTELVVFVILAIMTACEGAIFVAFRFVVLRRFLIMSRVKVGTEGAAYVHLSV